MEKLSKKQVQQFLASNAEDLVFRDGQYLPVSELGRKKVAKETATTATEEVTKASFPMPILFYFAGYFCAIFLLQITTDLTLKESFKIITISIMLLILFKLSKTFTKS